MASNIIHYRRYQYRCPVCNAIHAPVDRFGNELLNVHCKRQSKHPKRNIVRAKIESLKYRKGFIFYPGASQ